MIDTPKKTPNCCGKPAQWVVQSVNLAYFYCRECKNEVISKKEEPASDSDSWHWNGGFLRRWSSNIPNIMSLPKDFYVDYGKLQPRIVAHEHALDALRYSMYRCSGILEILVYPEEEEEND